MKQEADHLTGECLRQTKGHPIEEIESREEMTTRERSVIDRLWRKKEDRPINHQPECPVPIVELITIRKRSPTVVASSAGQRRRGGDRK